MNLPSVRDPIIWALTVVLLIVIVSLGITIWQNHSLETDLARSQAEAVALKADRDAVLAQRDEAIAANAAAARVLDAQSRAVATMKRAAEARQTTAGAAARVILAEKPALPEGHGPAVMNSWMREQFGSP